MPRYHFHVVDKDVWLDLKAETLRDDAATLERAEQLAATLLQDRVYASDPDAWEIRVTDEKGAEVLSLPLSEVTGKA